MPAVNPARLQSQIDRVLQHFGSPELFHRYLQDLFSQYANHALRFGEESQPQPLMRMFHLPDPVMRQLRLDLNPLVQAHPELSLEVCDELWGSDYFEIRLVAIHILSRVPAHEPEPILERLERWLTPDLDSTLAVELFSQGSQKLGKSHPQEWDTLLESFLADKDSEMIALGLIGFRESLGHSGSSNLPVILRKVSPIIQDPQMELMSPLKKLIETLADNYPEETVFFLKQNMALSSSALLTRLVKQCLPSFEDELQVQLKAALR